MSVRYSQFISTCHTTLQSAFHVIGDPKAIANSSSSIPEIANQLKGGHSMPRFTTRTLLALGFTLIVWASAYAGIRAGLRGYSPANLAILRFIIASIALAVYAKAAHFRKLEMRD